MPQDTDTHSAVDHLFRHRSGQMVAALTRIFGLARIDLVEEAVQEAMVKALKSWPFRGTPRNPTAWLIQAAKNHMLDRLRRQQVWQGKEGEVVRSITALRDSAAVDEPAFAREVRDDQLRLVFTCCHPAIPRSQQIALTLKTVGGFSAAEIARAFLAREATVAQRLVRAKRRLREQALELRMPPPDELPQRIDPVLAAIYLMFNEGYSAHQGEDLVRTDLCHEAIRLAELLASHPVTGLPPVHALAALLCFQAARLATRVDADGDLLLLAEQDRGLWDPELLRRGLEHLERSAAGDELTTYHLQAEIAACHALAASFEATDWPRILSAYDALLGLDPSPVVALNRTIALAQVEGPAAALEALGGLAEVPALSGYYPFHAVRARLLRQLGRCEQSDESYRRAMELTPSRPVRRFLESQIEERSGPGGP